MTALWLLGGAVAGAVVRREVNQILDSAIQEVAQRVVPLAYAELLDREDGSGEPPAVQHLAPVGPHSELITYVVRNADGRILLQSHDADASAFPASLAPGFADGPTSRLYTEVAILGTLFVTATEAPGYRSSSLMQATVSLLAPLVLLLPLTIFGIWALVAVSLRPVMALRREIEERGDTNLSPVGYGALPSEVRPAAEALNRLLLRLKRVLEAERSFAANSAHELRTPIAAALAQTQRLIVELPQGSAAARARGVEAALRQLARLSEKLLQLARAEGGGVLTDAAQDLSQTLSFLLDEITESTDHADALLVKLPDRGVAMSRLDVDAFAILCRNLIENALKHGDKGQAIEVRLATDGTLSVDNHAPAVDQLTLARLKRPFERGAGRGEGTGLGLAIAASIARAAGTKLELLSPSPGRTEGFFARVRLPLLSDPISRPEA